MTVVSNIPGYEIYVTHRTAYEDIGWHHVLDSRSALVLCSTGEYEGCKTRHAYHILQLFHDRQSC